MPTPVDVPHAALIVLVSALGGAANSVAGGGTLLTFPAIVALGVPPVVANATSTVALWPGALSSLWGYRAEVVGARAWARRVALPSAAGGLLGAWLLLAGGEVWFTRLVPWLVLSATLLFVAQRPLLALVTRRRGAAAPAVAPSVGSADGVATAPGWRPLAFMLLVAVYGGYFGAGAGILMLAALGLSGMTDIHQMNGLKNFIALCCNAVAIGTFALSGAVDWRLAALMAVGTVSGGYVAAGLARRAPQAAIRRLIAVIGFASAAWLLVRR
jgi:uncharacterized membrane protein YfcA